MSRLILPTPFTSQPTGAIKAKYPGLVHLWMYPQAGNGNSILDLAGSANGVFAGGGSPTVYGVYWAKTAYGWGLLCNNSNTGTIYSSIVKLGNSAGSGSPGSQTPFSFVLPYFYLPSSTFSAQSAIYSAQATFGIEIAVTSSSFITFNYAGSAVIVVSSNTVKAGWNSLAVTYDGSVGTILLNGTVTTASVARTFTNSVQYNFFSLGSGTDGWSTTNGAEFVCPMVFNRKIPLQEARKLLANPWQVFQRNRNLWVNSTAAATAPFIPGDLPNPAVRRAAAQDSPLDEVLGPIQLGSTPPFYQSDYPNPILKPFARQEWIYNGSLGPLVFGGPPPFFTRDWPNPNPRIAFRQEWDYNGPLGPIYFGPTPPFIPKDFPNPTLRVAFRQEWSYNTERILSTVFAPFFNRDFPNPMVRRAANHDWNYNGILGPIVLGPTLPFYQHDWPNPPIRKAAPSDWVYSNTIYQFIAIVSPFAQYDWQNPQTRKTAGVEELVNGALGPLTLGPTLPFYQHDWPNPNPRKAISQEWKYSTVILPGVLLPPEPFFQSDWPNPNPRSAFNITHSFANWTFYLPIVTSQIYPQIEFSGGKNRAVHSGRGLVVGGTVPRKITR